MPRFSKLARTQRCNTPAIASSASPFLLSNTPAPHLKQPRFPSIDLTSFFIRSLSYASSCKRHREPIPRLSHRLVHPDWSASNLQDGRFLHTTRPFDSGDVKRAPQARQVIRDPVTHAESESHEKQASGTTRDGFFTSSTQAFARSSTLPDDFYKDLERVAGVKFDRSAIHALAPKKEQPQREQSTNLRERMQLLQSVRELEEKLASAKHALDQSLQAKPASEMHDVAAKKENPVLLSKQDYLNLVDLYYYSQKRTSEPDSPDQSPTPLFIDDYSFELSRNFSEPEQDYPDIDEEDLSPLKAVEELLKSEKLKEISLMQAFVDLLLDDNSSNRSLFEVYKMFPDPGVAYLPAGLIRLFLQRMSTPRKRSEKAMLRYLSLMDDMQKAKLRITRAEWSSAIYLAGRSFSQVTEGEVSKAFGIWREMEEGAGVKATHVTFNILFDIAVRAEKFALAQNVLKEMHERGLRLNRLGRVSLMYYHGLRGDGDGVRKAYRDFVEAGEIVDTLVLNCVMASLIRAQEPVAAEQIYERMKQLQTRLGKSVTEDGQEALFMKYPPPGSTQINMQMASNSLGRILLHASRLRENLPSHHEQLQASMPLAPDEITFRSMISHHAGTSGDLDRLTVLLNDKTELMALPLTSLDFQLLFKGFAVHGESSAEEKWTVKRLDLVWEACMAYIKPSSAGRRHSSTKQRGEAIDLPTIQDINSTLATSPPLNDSSSPAPAAVNQPDAWKEFILDLAAFPRERLKRPIPVSNAFFPEDVADPVHPAQTADVDRDTTYALPHADVLAHRSDSTSPSSPSRPHADSQSHSQQSSKVEATRNLVIWLLRAYARCTRSRRRLEDVWFQVRRVWTPKDNLERDAVVKVLRRALRDCDMSGVMDGDGR